MIAIEEAKRRVVKAGIRLVETGLIARTWGNVSHRISEDQFVITPSGRDYRTIMPADLVTVNIADCSYNGKIKPSSEKGVHAAVYKQFPDVNFVIHTHQTHASVISACGLDRIVIEQGPLAGEVLCADYALPSTKKLQRRAAAALARTSGRAIILKNHGAICYGENDEEAFLAAIELESACQDFLSEAYKERSGIDYFDAAEMSRWALTGSIGEAEAPDARPPEQEEAYYNSRRTENGFLLYGANTGIEVRHGDRMDALPEEALIHQAIYGKHAHIQCVTWNRSPEIVAISESMQALKPLLDDFAQIAGTSAKVVEGDPDSAAAALKRSSVVLIRGKGALCCGSTLDDVNAVSMVLDKNGKAHIGASLFGKAKPIAYWECVLMRFVYKNKYAKQADTDSR